MIEKIRIVEAIEIAYSDGVYNHLTVGDIACVVTKDGETHRGRIVEILKDCCNKPMNFIKVAISENEIIDIDLEFIKDIF